MMRECTPMQVKMAPLINTERRIIIYLCSFMGGIIGLHCLGDSWLWHTRLMQITGAAICLMLGLLVLFIWVYLRRWKIAVIGPFIFALFCCATRFNLAALRLGQHAEPEKVQLCNEFCQNQLRRSEAVAVVLKRHGLSAACDDRNTDVIISLATPFYPCRTAKPIYCFTQNMDDNYLLYIDKTGINYVFSNSGSGQLACLALQPRQC